MGSGRKRPRQLRGGGYWDGLGDGAISFIGAEMILRSLMTQRMMENLTLIQMTRKGKKRSLSLRLRYSPKHPLINQLQNLHSMMSTQRTTTKFQRSQMG